MTKKYEDLEFTDNFMFVKIMDSHPDLCKEMLEMILNTKISRLEMIQYEDTMQPTYESKGVRLDVYLQDEAKSRYNIEMQAAPCPEIAKRSRYYHSTMDVEQLLKGEHYSELKKSFVIFICKDLGMEGYDLPIYTFMYRSEEDPEKYLNDETYTIFVNARLSEYQQAKAVKHELNHFYGDDFSKDNVNEIENK